MKVVCLYCGEVKQEEECARSMEKKEYEGFYRIWFTCQSCIDANIPKATA